VLYRRGNTWHFDFTLAGRRYRGSTRETRKTSAQLVEAKLKTLTEDRHAPVLGRAPLLGDFAGRFFDWLETSSLEPNTKRYYRNGWLRLEPTRLRGMRINQITSEDVDAVNFTGTASWVNQGLRTLHRMLGKAAEWKLLAAVPRIRLRKEYGRQDIIDPAIEAALLAHAEQPLRDVLIIMQDCGARPEEIFRISIENINLSARTIFNPYGKTRKARRYLPISDRMMDLLLMRCGERTSGWLFPSRRGAKCGHLTTVAKQFREARRAAGLSESLKLYAARHTFGTVAYKTTGNLAAVMDAMGHTDVRTTMRYQHQKLDGIREAINQRNAELPAESRHTLRHSVQ
jgi:integrase